MLIMNLSNEEIIKRRSEIIRDLKKELISRLDLAYEPVDIHEDMSLLGAGLGLDSLDALEIVLTVESCFGVKIADGNVSALRSVNTLVDYIIEVKNKEDE